MAAAAPPPGPVWTFHSSTPPHALQLHMGQNGARIHKDGEPWVEVFMQVPIGLGVRALRYFKKDELLGMYPNEMSPDDDLLHEDIDNFAVHFPGAGKPMRRILGVSSNRMERGQVLMNCSRDAAFHVAAYWPVFINSPVKTKSNVVVGQDFKVKVSMRGALTKDRILALAYNAAYWSRFEKEHVEWPLSREETPTYKDVFEKVGVIPGGLWYCNQAKRHCERPRPEEPLRVHAYGQSLEGCLSGCGGALSSVGLASALDSALVPATASATAVLAAQRVLATSGISDAVKQEARAVIGLYDPDNLYEGDSDEVVSLSSDADSDSDVVVIENARNAAPAAGYGGGASAAAGGDLHVKFTHDELSSDEMSSDEEEQPAPARGSKRDGKLKRKHQGPPRGGASKRR